MSLTPPTLTQTILWCAFIVSFLISVFINIILKAHIRFLNQRRLTSGLPWWLSSKESSCTAVTSLGQEYPLEKEMVTTLVFLSGKSNGRRAWWAIVYGVTKSQTWLCNLTRIRRLLFMTNNRQLVSLYYQKWGLAVCFPEANKETRLVERMLSSGGRRRWRQKSV